VTERYYRGTPGGRTLALHSRSLYEKGVVGLGSSQSQPSPKFELELKQTKMAQKPMLRAEV
jgi:hypothetical protein